MDLRSLILGVALALSPLPTLSLLGGISSAHAATPEPLFDAMQVQLIAPAEVMGDALTPTALYLVLLDADGTPLEGLVAKASTKQGDVGLVTAEAPGLYRLEWVAPVVDETAIADLRIKGKLLDKRKIDDTFQIPVRPALSQRVAVQAEPARLVLGDRPTARVSVFLSGGATEGVDAADLQIRTSIGEIANLTPLGDGSYTALYTAPAETAPSLAVVTVTDRRDPGRTYGSVRIPLIGRQQIEVEGEEGERMMARVAGREYGPEPISRGKASLEVQVPPGVLTGEAQLISDAGPRTVPLTLEPSVLPRMQMFPPPEGLPADPALGLPVRVFVAQADGTADAAAKVTLEATVGALSKVRHEGDGVYVAIFTPPAVIGDGAVQITATVAANGEGEPLTDSVSLGLVPGRPAKLTLETEPAVLGPDDKGFRLLATVSDDQGAGLAGRELALVVAGAKLGGPAKDLGDGTYEVQLETRGRAGVSLTGTVKAPATHNPTRSLVVFPSRARLSPDGLSSSMLTLLTLDEFGYPVADKPVSVFMTHGDGSVPKTARTDASGVAQVHYTAGREPGLVRIQFAADGRTEAVWLVQLPPDVAPSLVLPESGTPARRALVDSWRAIVTDHEVTRNR